MGRRYFTRCFGMDMLVNAVTSSALRRKSAGEIAYPKEVSVGSTELGLGKVGRVYGCASVKRSECGLGAVNV